MTSTNDGKEVKSNQTSGHKGKSYYIDLYKSLEKHLSEECELRVRTQHLCSAWRRVHSLCQHSASTTHPHYLAWLQRHTANTLLQSEWQSEKDEHSKLEEAIDLFIAESREATANRNGHSPAWESQLVQRGEWFKQILGNPWGHPVLKVLCDPRGKQPSDEDILEWLKEERGVMFVTRLRHLAASKKCHEIALSLASAVMDRRRACETIVPDAEQADEQEPAQSEGGTTFKDILRSEAGFTVDVWELLTDLELVLLHKRNEHSQCIALAKKIPLRSGYQLVERLRSRPETSPRERKLWKNAAIVATIVAQVLITRCMVVPSCAGAVRSALYCCARSLVRLLPPPALPAAAGALAAPAATARHLHTLAAAVHTQLHAQNAEDMNSFVCELYVRAITAGMNELEKLKLKTEKESEARSMEQTLATWFTSLGSLLSRSARIQCECALTAFSVHPSAALFDRIAAAPELPRKVDKDKQEPKDESQSEFGSWASDSRSQTNLVKTSETLNLKQTEQHTNVMSTAIFAEGEAIGLSAELCQDLTVCLSGPRIKTLSWDMDRASLIEKCRTHMELTAGGTKVPERELRFLNLDPTEYLHLPEEGDDESDVYYGIEKGYEHLVELQEEAGWEEAIFDHEATETAYSSEELVDIPVRRKKKSKRRTIPPEEEADPLSTVTEPNKGDKKKERPHSKERSKDKKKKHKTPEEKEKKKEKKERKKKESTSKQGSLASLVGVKVTKVDAAELGLTLSDSDYDSQGKSSLASDGNDPNVVFDGLFNMDDPLSEKPVNNGPAPVNGVVASKTKRKPSISKRKPKNTGNTTTETKPQVVKTVSSFLTQPPKHRPSTVGIVSEQVKRSITKLLQFRRNQNSGLIQKNTQITPKADPKPANAIYKPEFPTQQFISPKSVIVPEIPKSYINKELTDADRNRSVITQTQANSTPGFSLNRGNETQHNRQPIQYTNKSNHEVIVSPARNSAEYTSAANRYKEIMTLQQYYQNISYNLQSTPNILCKSHGQVPPKNIPMTLSRVETPKPQEHAKSFEDYLVDLKAAANPVSTPGVIAKKDVKPASRVPPTMPSLPYTDTTISLQCAKQVPQKKVENAPNTFSRLSYMKNKQSDLKQKQTLETQSNRQDESKASLDLSRCLNEFKNTKIKYIQTTKGETVITRVDNPLNLSCSNASVDRKAENNPSTSRSYPAATNYLQPTPVSRFDNVDVTKVTTPPAKTSYLSEKDQNDLLLLLRQQNRINSIGNVQPTPQAPVNMTKDNASNIIPSPVVVSKPEQRTTVLNIPLQHASTGECKESKSVETKPVKNSSKNANFGGRGKKASKSRERSNLKPKTKLESDTLDWEKVMNAIRAQKTPSRGPSALELALSTQSQELAENSLRNQRIVRPNSVMETDKISKTVDTTTISNANIVNTINPSVITKSLTNTSTPKSLVKSSIDIRNKTVITKTAQSDTQKTLDEYKKSVKNIPPKRPSDEMEKMSAGGEKNKFTTTIVKNKDPFISGKEEDYNLSDLDDLLDDELRRELGELSSDEESYRISQEAKGNKTLPCNKSDSSNKQVISNVPQKEKIQIPNVLSSVDTTREIPVVSDGKYTKSKDCVRNQTNKTKSKASVNKVQTQSFNKATRNETLNKNETGILQNLSQVTVTRCQPNNNIKKVSDPTIRYQYSTVNKPVQRTEMLNEVANDNTRNQCLQNPYPCASNRNNVEEPRKVFVVPALTQPPSNILILGPEMYYNPIPIIQNTMNPIFVQQNTLNMMPQPVFCAPSVSSHITTPVSVTTPTIVPQNTIIHETSHVQAITTTEQPVESNPNRSNEPKESFENTRNNEPNESLENTRNNKPNESFENTRNNEPNESFENTEKYALSDVQENKNTDATSKLPRSRSISTEEVLRDILNDQEQTNELVKNSVGKKILNDKTEPSINDIERLKRKRLAITNRQLVQSCIYPPIALSYSPIIKKSSHIDDCPKISQTLDVNADTVTPQDIDNSNTKGETSIPDDHTDNLQTIEKVESLVAETTKEPAPLHDQEPKDDHPQENRSNTTPTCSILLRSSNRKLPKLPTDVKDQNPIARKTKVRLKVIKQKNGKNKYEIKKDTKPKTEEQKLIPRKRNHKKKVKRKPVVLNESNLELDSKKHENIDNVNSESLSAVKTTSVDTSSLDVEDALFGSLIPNVKNVQSHSLSAPIINDSISENIKSNISTNKADSIVILPNKKVEVIAPQMNSAGVLDGKPSLRSNKVVILQNKKVSLRRKRKPKVVISNDTTDCSKNKEDNNTKTKVETTSNVSNNQRVLRSVTKAPIEKLVQDIGQSQILTEKFVAEMAMPKNKLTSVPKISPASVTKQDQSNSVDNNVRNKAEESKVIDELTKIIPNRTNHDLSEKVEKEDKKCENKTFQNILESFIVNNNHVLDVQNENELLENCEQTTDGEIQSSKDAEKTENSQVASESVLPSSNATPNIQKEEENKILPDKEQLPPFANTRSSNIVPTVCVDNKKIPEKPQLPTKESKKSISSVETDKCHIPQSFKDSIIIEEIPNSGGSDATKLLRVKLPNGKIFKASVYGKMHTSFDSLFDDPSLRAMLMSELNEQRKYTLNIKQVSKTNKENPHQPIETRIQEIQVKTDVVAPAVIETIDLLSDDEETDDISSFKTKSGVYKTNITDKEIVSKHQAKFDQNCCVSVEKLILPNMNTCPDDSQSPEVIEIESDSDSVRDTSLPPVYFNEEKDNMPAATFDNQNNPSLDPTPINATESIQDNVIDIDESSNDSIDLLKNCPDLPVDLILNVPLYSNNTDMLDNIHNTSEKVSNNVENNEVVNSIIDSPEVLNKRNESEIPNVIESTDTNKNIDATSMPNENDNKTFDGTVGEMSTENENSTVNNSNVEYDTVKDGTVKDGTVKDDTVKDGAVKDDTVEESTVKDITFKDDTVEESTVKDITFKDSTVEDSAVEDSTVEDSTVEDSTVKGSTVKEITCDEFIDYEEIKNEVLDTVSKLSAPQTLTDKKIDFYEELSKCRECHVSLSRCDDLLEFYNIQNGGCSVGTESCDINELKTIENDDEKEISEINEELDTKDMSDTDVSSTASISILQGLSFSENEVIPSENGRNSPVIEVFEAIASLKNKLTPQVEMCKENVSEKFKCNWFITKKEMREQYKFKDKEKDKNLDEENTESKPSSPLNTDYLLVEEQDYILVPSLVSILTIFFQNNNDILEKYLLLKQENENRTRLSRGPNTCLKRKMPNLSDNFIASKVSKCEKTEVSVEEDIKTLVLPSDVFNHKDSVIIEHDLHPITMCVPDITTQEIHENIIEIKDSIAENCMNTCPDVAPLEETKTIHERSIIVSKTEYETTMTSVNQCNVALQECQDNELEDVHVENISNDIAVNKSNNELSEITENINNALKQNETGISEKVLRPNEDLSSGESNDRYNNGDNLEKQETKDDVKPDFDQNWDESNEISNVQEQESLKDCLKSHEDVNLDFKYCDELPSTNDEINNELPTTAEEMNDEITTDIDNDKNEVENSRSISPCYANEENANHSVATDLINISEVKRINTEETKAIESKEQEPESQLRQIDGIIHNVTSPDPQNHIDQCYEEADLNISEKEYSVNDNLGQLAEITVREFLSDVLYVKENVIENNTDTKNQDNVDSVNELETKVKCNDETNDDQLVDSTTIEKSVNGQCDSTTDLNKIREIIDDTDIIPEMTDIGLDNCVALEVTCGDEKIDNYQDEISLGELICDEMTDIDCNEVIPDDVNESCIQYHNHLSGSDHDYICRCHPDETTKLQTDKFEIINDDGSFNAENHECYEEVNSQDKCLLEGVEINDPDVGILYVLFPIDDNTSETGTCNSIDDENETFEENEETDDMIITDDNITDDKDTSREILKVNIPKLTYSKLPTCGLRFKQNLKRKIEFTHSKLTAKRYRKGKNIDYPKITAAAILEQGYTKEYKRVFDYSSSLKFSLTQPFHKDFVDMDIAIKNWPIKGPCVSKHDLATESQSVLFLDAQANCTYDPLALKQTLAEEINQNYTENTEPSSDINEINFNMGFGEGSGRVIQNLEDVGDISKVSAATLSDVKQPQPFLLSEDCKYINNSAAQDDQSLKLQRYLSFIKLHNKVKSFFENNFIELTNDGLSKKKEDDPYSTNFPFDFFIQDFMEPRPFETIVQVVQVGQLPVSAAAQNPVTCDPRVTQVSDASPSQCSENSPHDESSTPIKTEYTELTTADLSLPLVQEYAHHAQTMSMDSHDKQNAPFSDENIPIETEIKSVIKIELTEELPEEKELKLEPLENTEIQSMEDENNAEYAYDTNDTSTYDINNVNAEYENAEYNNITAEYDNATAEYNKATAEYETTSPVVPTGDVNEQIMHNSPEKQTTDSEIPEEKQLNVTEKTDQIAHAMSAAGITTSSDVDDTAHGLFSKSINAMSLQQALAHILPPPLNPTNTNDNNQTNTQVTPQVLHIVQGKNASGSHITLVDNQQSVISGTNAPVLHIVQNKSGTTTTTNGAPGSQTNAFSGLSLVDAGLQQGGNQLLHIVNTGSQKNNNTGQLLKRVNLLTNLTNVQGNNEQKMVQFVCKSADGKSIQLNAPHQRSMVLRLQPIESPVPQPKPAENPEAQESPSPTNAQNKDGASQQEIKSRSVYEENYAKFIQNSSPKPAAAAEKSTSLPKFNQAFGKPVFQEGSQKPNEVSDMSSVNTSSENNECPPTDNNSINLEHISQISSPPLLLRKSPAQTSQAETNLVQQIKQTIAPMNIQTMHGGVIYTRQIPVNIGGGQTINLITVPSTELIGETGQKQTGTQGDIEPSIIKIVPQTQNNNSEISSEENGNNMSASNENNQNQPHPQPVLTQMRIKLPMLSKNPQMVSGARVVRPSFFQIQRNVIGGNNQPVYQQLVLTAAPPLGQQTIRLPTQANRPQLKVPSETQSTESMSSSTLEQLREFDMVLEQVKERSTVQPNSNTNAFPKLHTPSTDTTDCATSAASTPSESNQVLYSIGTNQSLNVAYVNRKTTTTTPTTSTFVRSPDSSGIADSPTSSTHVSIPHTVTTESTSNETPAERPKPAKVSSKSKSRPKSSSHPPNSMKINPVPPKTSTQKPLEDEQTTQRILYILAEYKEQVENSPDKDKPAPRRRTHPPSNPGSSKRKKSCSGSRHRCRDMSPVHGEDTCRTLGSEDSSCGTSQGDCNESCLDSHSPQDSPRKIVRKLTFEHEAPQPRPQPPRNVIVADGQTITVARGTAGKPTTAVLMPANYILPVSMVKGGQQIAIVTNRGPKLLTVAGGEGGATNALLLQRLIGPGLKPVLARPGVRHVRLPTAALHNLQAFNLAAATTSQPDSTAAVPPPDLVDTRAASSPWPDRAPDVKPERGDSPEGSEPWNLPASADPQDYTYEETVRADNMDRTVLDAMQDRYSPEMEAQRIFDKMFDVDSKKSYIVDSPRCGYDIDASDCDDKAYHQVVQKKEGSSQRHHRLTHVSAAALRHKYAILEHELRLQKSLSEECEDLGVDSPSASELFPEAELLFAASPAHEHTQEQSQTHTPQPTHATHTVPQPDMDDQIATDQLLSRDELEPEQLELGLEDVRHMTLDHEEFARAHPNTTFHSEPTDDTPVQPFTIAGLKGRHITSTIFHSNRAPATVLMTAPQTTVISQATPETHVKYDIDHMINLPSSHNVSLPSVLVKDDGLTRFDTILNDSRELHLTHTASAIVHSTGNATQVIRRVCYDDKRDNSFLMDEPDALIAGDDAKMIAEDSSRDATLESMADVDDDRSSPERHTELFWESNSASERSESRRPLDFSSDSDKCCKSPSYDETNSTDSSGVGTHTRLDSVIKDARGVDRSGSGSSASDGPRLRTYPAKRAHAADAARSVSGKTRAGERSPDTRRRTGRDVVRRGCHCCGGDPAPPRPKKSRQKKPTMDFD